MPTHRVRAAMAVMRELVAGIAAIARPGADRAGSRNASRNASRAATMTVGIVRARDAAAGTGAAGIAAPVVVAAVGTSRTSNSHNIQGRQRSLCPMA